MNDGGNKSGIGSFSLIHHTLPFDTTRREFDELRCALLTECDLWRKENCTWTERLKFAWAERFSRARQATHSDTPDWYKVSILLHECTHFWHVIGTTCGFHLMRIAMAQSYWTRKLLDTLAENGFTKFNIPLKTIDISGCSDPVKSAAESIRDRWHCLEIYRRALQAFSMPQDVSAHDFFNRTWPGAVAALDEFDRSVDTFGVRAPIRHLRLNYPIGVPTVAPLHPTYGLHLSGQAVMEAAALMQETLLLFQLRDRGELSHEFVDRRITENPAYGMALEVFGDAVPDFDQEPIKSKLVRIIPRLLDLALMGPLDPDYGFDPPEALYWPDIHPGFRFRLIMDTVKEIGLGSVLHTSYFGDGYDQLVGDICRRNNWPTPETIAGWGRRRRQQFRSEYEGLNLGAHLSTNPNVDPTVTHFDAIAMRLSAPTIFADTVVNFRVLFDGLPPPFIQLDDASIVNSLWGGYVFYNGIMRTIFDGMHSELLQFATGSAASQFGQEIDNLFRAALWQKIGYDLTRFG